mmetsp:Transcript_8347/g.23502  ORF Transcript_8347/g.23502 Transcript_8347/m.23502 type:complete len:526 (-) Transcript_8347:1682-3259(-)
MPVHLHDDVGRLQELELQPEGALQGEHHVEGRARLRLLRRRRRGLLVAADALAPHGDAAASRGGAPERIVELARGHGVVLLQGGAQLLLHATEFPVHLLGVGVLVRAQGLADELAAGHQGPGLQRPLRDVLLLLGLALEEGLAELRELVHRLVEEGQQLRGGYAEVARHLVEGAVLAADGDEDRALHGRQRHARHPSRQEEACDGGYDVEDQGILHKVTAVLFEPMNVVSGEELKERRRSEGRLALHDAVAARAPLRPVGRRSGGRATSWRVDDRQREPCGLPAERALQQAQEAQAEVRDEVVDDRGGLGLALQRRQRFDQDARVLSRRRVRRLPQVHRAEATLPPELVQLEREPEGRPDVVQVVRGWDVSYVLEEGRGVLGRQLLLEQPGAALLAAPGLPGLHRAAEGAAPARALLEPGDQLPDGLRRVAHALQPRMRCDPHYARAAELPETIVEEVLAERPRDEVARRPDPALERRLHRLRRDCPLHADLDGDEHLRELRVLRGGVDGRQHHQKVVRRRVRHE